MTFTLHRTHRHRRENTKIENHRGVCDLSYKPTGSVPAAERLSRAGHGSLSQVLEHVEPKRALTVGPAVGKHPSVKGSRESFLEIRGLLLGLRHQKDTDAASLLDAGWAAPAVGLLRASPSIPVGQS